MKVLIYLEGGIPCVVEVIKACYTEDLAKDIGATCFPTDGLVLVTKDTNYGFPGVSKEECEEVVRELFFLGKHDLTRFGYAQ